MGDNGSLYLLLEKISSASTTQPKTKAIITPIQIKHVKLNERKDHMPSAENRNHLPVCAWTPTNQGGRYTRCDKSFRQVFGEAGIARGLQALNKMNKKAGSIAPAVPGPTRMMKEADWRNIVKMARRPLQMKLHQKDRRRILCITFRSGTRLAQ